LWRPGHFRNALQLEVSETVMNEQKQQYGEAAVKTRVLVLDGHAVIRRALVEFINQQPHLIVCAELENPDGIFDVVEGRQVDLAIIDVSPEETAGIKVAEELRVRCPGLPVLVLSAHDQLHYCERAFRAGARGYVVKHEMAETIVTAIREVLGGRMYISAKTAAKMARAGVSGVSDFLRDDRRVEGDFV
jgi:DNA-binding NarL/FixJ family response regulator